MSITLQNKLCVVYLFKGYFKVIVYISSTVIDVIFKWGLTCIAPLQCIVDLIF